MLAIALTTFVAADNAFAKGAGAKGKGKGKDAGPTVVRSDTYVKYDTNISGVLEDTEKAAIIKDFEADKTGPLKAFDTDGDGKLSDAEIAAIPATSTAAPAPAKPAKGKGKGKKK